MVCRQVAPDLVQNQGWRGTVTGNALPEEFSNLPAEAPARTPGQIATILRCLMDRASW
jgi:hypothetical protein